jgi:YidC/Oxa1 family membrane protein insertase
MSGVFVLMFYSFPSGLVLYWLVSNLLGIAQQMLVNRANLNKPAAS